MFAKKSALAKEFASKTPSIKALPNKVKKLTPSRAKRMTTSNLEKAIK